jgi:hypothetical protein
VDVGVTHVALRTAVFDSISDVCGKCFCDSPNFCTY